MVRSQNKWKHRFCLLYMLVCKISFLLSFVFRLSDTAIKLDGKRKSLGRIYEVFVFAISAHFSLYNSIFENFMSRIKEVWILITIVSYIAILYAKVT